MRTGKLKHQVKTVAWPGHAATPCTLPAGAAVREVMPGFWVIADDAVAARATRDPKRARAYYVYVGSEHVREDDQ